MAEYGLAIGKVVVLGRGDGYSLRRVPVGSREGQEAGIDGKVGISTGAENQDGQRADRLIFKPDGVGRGRSLGDGDGSGGEKEALVHRRPVR